MVAAVVVELSGRVCTRVKCGCRVFGAIDMAAAVVAAVVVGAVGAGAGSVDMTAVVVDLAVVNVAVDVDVVEVVDVFFVATVAGLVAFDAVVVVDVLVAAEVVGAAVEDAAIVLKVDFRPQMRKGLAPSTVFVPFVPPVLKTILGDSVSRSLFRLQHPCGQSVPQSRLIKRGGKAISTRKIVAAA